MRDRDDERRRAGRLDVDARAVGRARSGRRRRSRRSFRRPASTRRCPQRRRRRSPTSRAVAAGQLVPARPARRAAEDRVHDARSRPWLACVPSGASGERAFAAALVADRRHAALADRQLQMRACRRGRRSRAAAGRPGGAARALAGAGAAAGRPEPPNADRSSVTSATTTIAIRTARRRSRRSRSRCAALASSRARRLVTGGGIRGTVANAHGGSTEARCGAVDDGSSQSSAGRARAAVDAEGPVPIRRPEAGDAAVASVRERPRPVRRGSRSRAGSSSSGLPLLLVLAWIVASAAAHVVFLFVVAALVALLLDPLVRALQRVRLPRGLSVALVYLSFAAALGLIILAVTTAVVGQTKTAATRFNDYFTNAHGTAGQTSADRDVDRLQHWLNTHRLKSVEDAEARPQARAADPAARRRQVHEPDRHVRRGRGDLDRQDALLASCCSSSSRSTCCSTCSGSGRAVDRRFPPRPGEQPLLRSIEHALASYVRGQAALVADHRHERRRRAVGARARSACCRTASSTRCSSVRGSRSRRSSRTSVRGSARSRRSIYALVVHPISALWVVLLFLAIHQIEGHVVVPNVMGNALRLHPLLVIFGLATGAEVYGLPGALIALPLLAVGRAIWEFFVDRIHARAVVGAGAGAGRASSGRAAVRAYASAVSTFPVTRLRRLRRTGALRDLVRETSLSLDDLVDAALRRARGAAERAAARPRAPHRRLGRARVRRARCGSA